MNILIVDDEKMSRMTLESIFSGYGTCKSFESGKMAVKSFISCLETKEKFDLVILDIFLENENGVDILRLIRLYEKVMGITQADRAIIFMATSNTDMDVVKECIKEGCNDYLVKPLTSKVIVVKMAKYHMTPLSI